jgi:hypothetical protein
MIRISTILSLTTFLLFTSCSPRSNQILLQDESNFSESPSVSIMLIEADHLFDYFPNHSFGALRPTEQNIFENQLVQLFSEQTQTPVSGKKRSTYFDPNDFEVRQFETANSDFTILSPKPGTDLTSSENNSRYTLILDRYFFISYQVSGGAGSYAGHEQEMQNRIKFDLKYVIWDNELKEEIGWGNVDSDHLIFGDEITAIYRDAISTVFQKIINVSPFQPV